MTDFRVVPIESIVITKNISRQSKKIDAKYLISQAFLDFAAQCNKEGISPLKVKFLAENKYELIAGERRYHAAKHNKQKTVPVIVSSYENEIAQKFSNLIENEARENPTNADLAIAYAELQEDLIKKGMTRRAATCTIAAELKKSSMHVEKLIRIRNRLIPELFRAFEGRGGIPLTVEQASAYAGLPVDEQREEWLAWNGVGGRRPEISNSPRTIPIKHQPIGKLLQIRRTLQQKRDVAFYWRDGVFVDSDTLSRFINWFLSTTDESPFKED